MRACGQNLAWRWREDAALGQPHNHYCWLEQGHPVSDGTGVQIHRCDFCTLAWESDRRPHVHCRCQGGLNPDCPTHGTKVNR